MSVRRGGLRSHELWHAVEAEEISELVAEAVAYDNPSLPGVFFGP
jgi:hypothetical protein